MPPKEQIKNIISQYQGDGTWRNYSRMINDVSEIYLNNQLTESVTKKAIVEGLKQSNYLQNVPARDSYFRNMAVCAWKNILRRV